MSGNSPQDACYLSDLFFIPPLVYLHVFPATYHELPTQLKFHLNYSWEENQQWVDCSRETSSQWQCYGIFTKTVYSSSLKLHRIITKKLSQMTSSTSWDFCSILICLSVAIFLYPYSYLQDTSQIAKYLLRIVVQFCNPNQMSHSKRNNSNSVKHSWYPTLYTTVSERGTLKSKVFSMSFVFSPLLKKI